MNLEEKSQAVIKVLHELDEEIKQFQSWSSLGCRFGCGKCCFKPDIEATPLEFLPFAVYLCENGKAEEWLARLDSPTDDKICVILNPTQAGAGLCSEYVYRGMICRLFGFSARTNKYGQKELVTCSIIKTEQQENYLAAESRIKSEEPVPLMADYYLKLHYIDPTLANDFMPINQAIRRALDLSLQYFTYKGAEE
jgi:Fe-S-cluster containining protein